MCAWLRENWERCFLFLIALVFLTFSIRFFLNSEVTGATAAFVMFFLCLIYANVSRFKRFKGLGFEAELWEDKQKEAADLIDRLANIVQVYTREIVMMKVMMGRWGGGKKWPERWALYDELVGQHDTLGQKIDFLPLKDQVYRVMVFDAVSGLSSKVQQTLSKAHTRANEAITKEFGNPIRDSEGFGKRHKELIEIKREMRDLFKTSQKENIARFVLNVADQAVRDFKEKFDIDVEIPVDVIEKLRKIEALVEVGDLRIDEELMDLADREE